MKTVSGNWGSIFKAAMDEQGITADKMSKDLQIPLRSVYNYLSNRIEPTATPFRKITNYLKIQL